ncbi:hypothetical protein [Oricola sp.]|uniref:hypothetical protein n=1 Tax=Oricola sp. TaxID=1979950 RepID=UPI0025EC800D|nr:hypothetical protein [Oricola sp.]MCI5078572.1 hypothetical protein [Oricola sp.]
MTFAQTLAATIRIGTHAAGVAGFVASAIVVAIIADDFMETKLSFVLAVSAMVAATATMALFWRWLTPTPTGFSYWRAGLAGALSAISSSMLMWLPTIAFTFQPVVGMLAEKSEMHLLLPGILYLSVMTIVFSGWVTVPAAIVAACLVTLWARRRMETP